MRGVPKNDAKIGNCGTEMYVGKKGPLFELISCLRDARSNGRETISLFKYPIHVFVHFCPTWDHPRQGLGNGSRGSRAGRSVVVLVKVGRLGSVVVLVAVVGSGSSRACQVAGSAGKLSKLPTTGHHRRARHCTPAPPR